MAPMQEFVEKLVAWRRLVASALLGLFAVGIFAHALLGKNGWLSYRQKQAEFQTLQEEIQRTDDENHRLEAEIKALKSDPKAIEKEAREQLRYAKPGEVIYLLPEQPAQAPNPAAPQNQARR